jgi:hypothetical protein
MLAGSSPIYAGLRNRDMRPYGGHLVRGIAEVADSIGSAAVNVIHVGGETLTCEAWEAAGMLLEETEAIPQTVLGSASDAQDGLVWAARILGTSRRAPYVLPKTLFETPGLFAHNGVGGVAFDIRDPEMRTEVLNALRAADFVGVRDHLTQRSLSAYGLATTLMPDPGAMTAELFHERIAQHRARGEVCQTCGRFPGGFCAVQFSADFADDASLATLAAQLDEIVKTTRLSIVFFRAGAAPQHDKQELYRRVQALMTRKSHSLVFESLDVWDICALIAASRAFVGSSLHGRILALSYGLPRVSLLPPSIIDKATTKHAAYIETWDDGAMPGVVSLEHAVDALQGALVVDPARSLERAKELAGFYRKACKGWLDKMRAAE